MTPEQEPELHGVVDRLCALADMKKPRVAIAEVDMPNAFATGRNPSNAVVCATRGIMRRLDEPELEAVLAHELSHVAHRDVAVMTIASFLGMCAGLITRFTIYAGLFGGFGGGSRDNAGRPERGGDRAGRHPGVGDHLCHQLPAHHGAVALPGARRRPVGGDPHRAPLASSPPPSSR